MSQFVPIRDTCEIFFAGRCRTRRPDLPGYTRISACFFRPSPSGYLIASLGHLERERESAAACEKFVKEFPDYNIETYFKYSRYAREEDAAELVRDGLRKAGLPG